MSLPRWKEHFTQPVTGFDPVEAQGLTELGYALIHRQIDEQEYLSWARNHYEMASVDVNFFQKQPPPLSLVRRLKDSYSWGPEILPVAEWDGHLIVLSLEKPELEIPKELKPIVLLAPVSELHKYWGECLKDLETENSAAAEGAEPAEASAGMLEGISLEPPTAVTTLDFSGLRPQIPIEKTAITKLAKVDLDKTQPGAKVSPPPTTEISIDINTVITKIDKPRMAPAAVAKPTAIKPLTPVASPASIPVAKIPIIPGKQQEAEKKSPLTPPASAEVLKKAEPQVIAIANSNAPIQPEKVLSALSQFSHIYENRCYVEFDIAKQTAKVTQWPQEANMSVTTTHMPLDQDSFLKIVAKTQKPYHGHLIKTGVVDSFFKEVNQGHIPENVTLVPLVKAGDVIGAVMGWGPKTAYTMPNLREIERIVQNLCIELGFTPVEAA